MEERNFPARTVSKPLPLEKFTDPDWTAKGETRAYVALKRLETLWINTGTLCNIQCAHCYINSGPKNDQLSYFRASDAERLFDEIEREKLGTHEIGFTGGEPFMNPEFLTMLEAALARGFEALVLTNAMQPMQRPKPMRELQRLHNAYNNRLTFRVSLDHYTPARHEKERGKDSFEKTLKGLDWLASNGFKLQIAGRTRWHEEEERERTGYRALIDAHNWPVDAYDPAQLVLFPEMDGKHDVPEITTQCWSILGLRPDAMMCATSRMVVLRRGENRPTILPCTLIADHPAFDMGETLKDASEADGGMFREGAVKLCHPHCAKFCVLGGGSCSVS